MSDTTKQMLEKIYTALHANNAGLDALIVELRALLQTNGAKSIEMEKERLPQNNRQGRKMLQTYFKKRGVDVTYAE